MIRIVKSVSLLALAAPLCALPIFFAPTAQAAKAAAQVANPLIAAWTSPDDVPPYDRIKPEHFMPAFDKGLAEARQDIARIASNRSAPTFANTIEAMEKSGRLLSRVSATFFNLSSADAKPEIQKIEEAVSPKLTKFNTETYLNQKLFARVDKLYKSRATLNLEPEQLRLLEEMQKSFVRAGAALPPESRVRVAAINQSLSAAAVKFGQHLIADQKAGDVFLTQAEVAGLSPEAQKSAAAGAETAGRKGEYLIKATRSAVEPFLFSASDRAAREKVFRAFTMRGENANANNNLALIREMLTLRAERAKLMGAKSHAHFILQDSMAKTPEAAMALLNQVFEPGLAQAREEERALLAIAAKDGITKLEPWDWRFYAEQVRKQRFNLDEAALKQYFPLDGMVDALMETTTKLYGLTFHPRPDIPPYAPGVKVWEIREADGTKVGLFYGDWFTRDTKSPGAWMNSLREQSTLLGEYAIVVNNCNYTPPAPGERALISLDDAETLFHEFGHALHGLLSKVRYPSLSGTSVSRDFVEFPAQVYEHWIAEPQILRRHAKNAQGEPIPEAMLQALLKARTFNQGFLTTQQLSSAILDMELHSMASLPADFDAAAWEKQRLAQLGVPHAVGMRHRLPHFSHIFDGGYSAGYYAYTWAEAMDADGFEAFKESGDVFNPVLAKKLRTEVLERGNSRDPAASYIAFRGRMPNADALLRNRGLK
jgi:peptidyl-dipeptidase Dcp